MPLPKCTLEQHSEIWKNRHSLIPALQEICKKHSITPVSLKIFETGSNVVARITRDLILKLYFPFLRHQFEAERAVLKAIQGRMPVQTPKLHFEGEHDEWPYLILSNVEGTSLKDVWSSLDSSNKESLIEELGQIIRALHEVPITSLIGHLPNEWNTFLKRQIAGAVSLHKKTNLPENLLTGLETYLPQSPKEIWDEKSECLVSGDFTPEHLLLSKKGNRWTTTGLIDFADSMIGQREYDLTGPVTFIIPGERLLLKRLLMSYGYESSSLTPGLSKQLMQLTLLHRFANFKLQIAAPDWEQKVNSLEDLEQFLWGF